jgi:hypothetical protein
MICDKMMQMIQVIEEDLKCHMKIECNNKQLIYDTKRFIYDTHKKQ